MAQNVPPNDLTPWVFPDEFHHDADLIAVGVQESEYEVRHIG